VKAKLARPVVEALLVRGQQIEQQGSEAMLIQAACDIQVARASPRAAAAVREQNDAARFRGQREICVERSAVDFDAERARRDAHDRPARER
jgi:hypothetical protein